MEVINASIAVHRMAIYGTIATMILFMFMILYTRFKVKHLYKKPWYKHSNSVIFAMICWIFGLFAGFTFIFMTTNVIVPYEEHFFQRVCRPFAIISIFCCGFAKTVPMLVFIACLQETFEVCQFQYTKKLLQLLKFTCVIPAFALFIPWLVTINYELYKLKDDSNVFICLFDQSTNRHTFWIVIYGVCTIFNQLGLLALFFINMRTVKT